MKRILVGFFAAALIFAAIAGAQYATKVYHKQGGAEMVVASSGQITVQSGGELEVESGGTIDVESGGYLKIAGTQMTASATELNRLASVTAGTASASKGLVLGTLKDVDSTWVSAFGTGMISLRPVFRSDVSDSALTAGLSSGVPYISFFGTDDDTFTLTMNTSDQLVFSGVGGGFLFDGTNTVTSAELNTLAGVTAGSVQKSKALVIGSDRAINSITVKDTLDTDSALIRVTTGSTLDVESGGTFKLAGTTVSSTANELNTLNSITAGTTAASKALVVDTLKGLDSLWVANMGQYGFVIRPTFRSNAADSSLTAGLSSGVPFISFYGTDGDTWTLTMDTEDRAVFSGVTAYQFDGSNAITPAEINVLGGVTPGTTTASKALVVDAQSKLNALTVTALSAGTRTLVDGYYKGIQSASGPDSVDVAGLDATDYVLATITRKAVADSSIVLLYAIPASPTAGKLYLKFSATPSDTIGVSILTLQD